MMDTLSVSVFDLMATGTLVLMLAGITSYLGLELGRSLIVSALRTTIQLLLVGLVLKVLFQNANLLWVLMIALIMLVVAGYEATVRQDRRFSGWWGYGLGTLTMFLSSFAVTALTLLVILGPQPWYDPRYAVPLLGMILGNTMTGVALGLGSLTRLAWQQREVIEARLLLGHDPHTATSNIRRQSVHTGLTPIINAMAASGLVSLPGMMTGQILAGNPPMEAVKYQILIMFLIAAGTGFATVGSIWLGSKHLFDGRQRLRVDRLRAVP
jgi:putative ABC transport system permease protein